VNIEVIPVYGSEHLMRRIVIEMNDSDLALISRDDLDIGFWQQMDMVAAKFGIAPFCPCHERPHRISCPIGFNKYFRGRSLYRGEGRR